MTLELLFWTACAGFQEPGLHRNFTRYDLRRAWAAWLAGDARRLRHALIFLRKMVL